jgi:hypothetical protein
MQSRAPGHSYHLALVVTDYDAAHGVLSITKARVNGIDQDVTKTGEDRRIVLSPRAVAILERQLRLRERAVAAGLIHHEALFFTNAGAPIQQLGYGYWRWQRTLKRLAMGYRKPYVARHTSVSWKLMVGRNPLLVAKEHGHRLTTMLSVYAAWAEGAVESDLAAIREAMNRTAPPAGRPDHRLESSGGGVTAPLGSASQPATGSRRRAPVLAPEAAEFAAPATPADAPPAALPPPAAVPGPLGSGLVSSEPPPILNLLKYKENLWWKGRDSSSAGISLISRNYLDSTSASCPLSCPRRNAPDRA